MQWPHKGDKSHCGSCIFPSYYENWTCAYLLTFPENLFIKPKPYAFLSLMSSAFHKLKEVWQLNMLCCFWAFSLSCWSLHNMLHAYSAMYHIYKLMWLNVTLPSRSCCLSYTSKSIYFCPLSYWFAFDNLKTFFF